MAGNFWRTEGFNGLTRFYGGNVPASHITDVALEGLLCALVAKHGLSDGEVVDCFLRATYRDHKDHMRITRENHAIQQAECTHQFALPGDAAKVDVDPRGRRALRRQPHGCLIA